MQGEEKEARKVKLVFERNYTTRVQLSEGI